MLLKINVNARKRKAFFLLYAGEYPWFINVPCIKVDWDSHLEFIIELNLRMLSDIICKHTFRENVLWPNASRKFFESFKKGERPWMVYFTGFSQDTLKIQFLLTNKDWNVYRVFSVGHGPNEKMGSFMIRKNMWFFIQFCMVVAFLSLTKICKNNWI